MELTGRTVSVAPYTDEYESIDGIPIATVATAYDCPLSGQTYVLILNEALYFGDRISHSLLCPNQLRDNGIMVDDCPRQFDNRSSHAIFIPEADLWIPLTLDGIISGFSTRMPTADELDNGQHVTLTDNVPWDPSSPTFEVAEERQRGPTSKIAAVSILKKKGTAHKKGRGTVVKWQVPPEVSMQRIIMRRERKINAARVQVAHDARHFTLAETAAAEHALEGDGWLVERLIATARIKPVVGNSEMDVEKMEVPAEDELNRRASAMRRGDPQSDLTPEVLSRRWGIGMETARRTLRVTTQYGMRRLAAPAQRRFRTSMPHIRYPRLPGKFYADTMAVKPNSIRGYRYAHIIGNGYGYSRFYPMKRKNETDDSLDSFVKKVGIPEHLITDEDPTMRTWKNWKDLIKSYRIKQTWTEPHSPWQNRAELDVREVRRGIRRHTLRANSPKRLWCFLGEHVTAIRRFTAYDNSRLRGRCAAEEVLGYTPDISPYVQHDWWEVVQYLDNDGEPKLAFWIGVAEDYGGGDAFWVLPRSAIPQVRSTVWALTVEEREHPDMKEQIDDLIAQVHNAIGDDVDEADVDPNLQGLFPEAVDEIFDDTADVMQQVMTDWDMEPLPEADDYTPEATDNYISASVLLPRGGEQSRGTVIRRRHDQDGKPVGRSDPNPILDTREYIVEFEDGAQQAYAANLIAENLYANVDEEGRHFSVLQEIIDHRRRPSAVPSSDGVIRTATGERPRRTTRGWDLLVEWKDGSSTWVPLKDIKESNPVDVAEYAVGNKIDQEPAFAWWVPFTLRKRDRIIKKVKSKYWSRTHKYGVQLPKTVQDALRIDKETGTDLWRKAIEKEMRNVRPALEFNDDDVIPVGHSKVRLHGIFDVKMDLTRKFRLVANGNETDPPKESVYSTVVSRDSVRLFFLLAALNDLDVLSADIQNAYLSAPCKEKLYTIAGPEWGPQFEGRPGKIVKALYGLRTSGKAFADHLSGILRDLGYTSCKADPNVWMRPSVKENGDRYYAYVINYVDDVCAAMANPAEFMKLLGTRVTLKEGSVKEPDVYLGANVTKWRIDGADDHDKPRWALSSTTYTKRAIADVETELAKIDQKLATKVKTPLAHGYRPELDASPELNGERLSYYQGLIGVLRWICELGRIDILMPVSLMSRFLASPREGHLEQLFHIFAYLKAHERSTMVFDDTIPLFDEDRFSLHDWDEYYPGANEAIPHDAPEALGNFVVMTCFCDSDHAGCRVTRRSHTGIIIFVNRAPILWHSKRQNTVEASTYGSEMIAMRTALEMIEGLRYKLRMMGVPIRGPCNVFCDNEGVVKNVVPESQLKKKHAAINYHRVREGIAAGTIRVAKEDTSTNLSDIATKLLPGPALSELTCRILW